MEIEQTHRHRVSAIIFNTNQNKETALLLHLGRKTKPPRSTKPGELVSTLPQEPESWLPLTAKVHRSPSAYGNFFACARKKCGLMSRQVASHRFMGKETVEKNGRYHYWIIVELTERIACDQPCMKKFFKDTRWVSAHDLLDIKIGMSHEWIKIFGSALLEATEIYPVLGDFN